MKFGGLDIIINSAGLAISKSIQNTTEKDWDKLQRILVKGQFLFSKLASIIFCAPKILVFTASKGLYSAEETCFKAAA